MVRYRDDLTFGDDFDDQMHDQGLNGYRDGVDRVVEYIKAIHAYPKLEAELTWAIKEGII